MADRRRLPAPSRFISSALKWMPCASQVRALEPAALLEIVERPAAVYLLAEVVLVLGLGEMGVQADIELVRELGGRAHQRGRHRKRRAWRQRDLHHGVLAALVMSRHHALAVGQNRVLVLHHAVRRQAAVALRAVHRAARQQHAHAEPLRHRDLDIDGVLEPGRKDVMMIGGRGAARQQQFRHRHGDAEVKRFRRQPRPDRIERLQPREQFAVERRRQRPRQGLVEMMMGVDQPRKHDMRAGVEDGGIVGRRLLAAPNQFDDLAALHDDAALGAVGQDSKGILDPNRMCLLHDPTIQRKARRYNGVAMQRPSQSG